MPLFGDQGGVASPHASDEDLVLLLDGQLSSKRAASVRSHLEACWLCRTRSTEIQGSIGAFMDAYGHFCAPVAQAGGNSSSVLRQRLRNDFQSQQAWRAQSNNSWRRRLAPGLALACALAVLTILSVQWSRRERVVAGPGILAGIEPKPTLTPGETVLVTRSQVCSSEQSNNDPLLSPNLAHLVLRRYGLPDNRRSEFELDYLITPELGGATSVQNIWPEPYANTVWNAHVKDQLEDHLRKLVCDGRLDLRTAQRDMASDWIHSYQRYFSTRLPIRVRSHPDRRPTFTVLAAFRGPQMPSRAGLEPSSEAAF